MSVDVTVTDVDDEVARFERSWYRFDVAENQPGGTVVGRVNGIDQDLPPFNSFHYQLDAPTSEDAQNDLGKTATATRRCRTRKRAFYFYSPGVVRRSHTAPLLQFTN